MKKIAFTVAVLLGTIATKNTFAHDGIKIVDINFNAGDLTFKAIDGLKFKLQLDPKTYKSYITIKDNRGEEIYSEVVNKDTQFTKVYDLNNLPNGYYKLEIITGNEKTIREFEISNDLIKIAKN